MSALDQAQQGQLFDFASGSVLTGLVKTENVAAKKQYTAFYRPRWPEIHSIPVQMSREEARASFVYTTDGRLWWRKMERRRRPEAGFEVFRKRIDASPVWEIWAGRRGAQSRYMRRYLVWNWHFGATDRVLLPANGDTLDDRIENIVVGDLLPTRHAEHFAASAPRPDTGIVCPCCGAPAPVLSPNLLARALRLPPQQEVILDAVWKGKGRPVTAEHIISEMYADDLSGGPEYETARNNFKTKLCLLRKSIEGTGVRIEPAGYQRGYRLVIERPEVTSNQREE